MGWSYFDIQDCNKCPLFPYCKSLNHRDNCLKKLGSLPIAGGGVDDVDDDRRQVGCHEDGGGIPAEDNLNLETSLVWQKSQWQQLAALQLVLSLPGQPHIHLLLNCFKLNVKKVGEIRQENHLARLSIKRVVCDVKHAVKGSCVVAYLEEN